MVPEPDGHNVRPLGAVKHVVAVETFIVLLLASTVKAWALFE